MHAVHMRGFHYYVPTPEDTAARDESFHRMAARGLLPWAMSAPSRCWKPRFYCCAVENILA